MIMDNNIIILAIIAALIVSPGSVVVFGMAVLFGKILKCRMIPFALIVPGVIMLRAGIVARTIPTIVTFLYSKALGMPSIKVDPIKWIMSDCTSWGIALLLLVFALAYLPYSSEPRRMIREQERKEKTKYNRYKTRTVDYLKTINALVLGTTGSGKSVFLSRMTEEILNKTNDFVVLIDGKGSAEKYSLYDNITILAEKYNRKLVLLNATGNRALGGITYNPFEGVNNIQTIKDMIMELMHTDDSIIESSGTEHYKTMFETWVLTVLNYMQETGVTFTLLNIANLLDADNIKQHALSVDISPMLRYNIQQQADYYKPSVEAEVTKLKRYLEGVGKEIFAKGDGVESFNLTSAYTKNAIVLVLVDEMSMPGLAKGIARLVTMDMRNLVAARLSGNLDTDRHCRLIMDEFSAYASKVVLTILSRARSSGCNCVLGTQSVSDIKKLSVDFFGSVIDNINRLVVFRQNAAESAEEIANMIGTELSVSQTMRSTYDMHTGEGSNTLEREFRVSPDYIKSLEKNRGILFDKDTNGIKIFKNKFSSRQ